MAKAHRICRPIQSSVDGDVEIDQPESELRHGLKRRLQVRAVVSGCRKLMAEPVMIDKYLEICEITFAAIGAHFNGKQSAKLRAILVEQLNEAFKASPKSEILITYESAIGRMVNYNVNAQ